MHAIAINDLQAFMNSGTYQAALDAFTRASPYRLDARELPDSAYTIRSIAYPATILFMD